MSNEIDFKSLWNKEEAKDIPDMKELFKKANSLRRAARCRLIGQTVILLGTVALLLYIGLGIANRPLTTTVGFALMLIAIVSYLVASTPLLPMLLKSNIDSSSHEYLDQLIRIKRKHEFLDRSMSNFYFSLLSVGVALCMLDAATKMSTLKAVLVYVIILGCIGFSWLFSAKQNVKRTHKPLGDLISKLEAMNAQLREIN